MSIAGATSSASTDRVLHVAHHVFGGHPARDPARLNSSFDFQHLLRESALVLMNTCAADAIPPPAANSTSFPETFSLFRLCPVCKVSLAFSSLIPVTALAFEAARFVEDDSKCGLMLSLFGRVVFEKSRF